MQITVEMLREMDWRLFEVLTQEILQSAGYEAKLTRKGEDGGIDIVFHSREEPGQRMAVQCKRYRNAVQVKQVREFLGAMTRDGFVRGLFVTSGFFNERTLEEFRNDRRLLLVDGDRVIDGIRDLGEEVARSLAEKVFSQEDWRVPSCPICEKKMVKRQPREGESWKPFWGCSDFGKTGCAGRLTIEQREWTGSAAGPVLANAV